MSHNYIFKTLISKKMRKHGNEMDSLDEKTMVIDLKFLLLTQH